MKTKKRKKEVKELSFTDIFASRRDDMNIVGKKNPRHFINDDPIKWRFWSIGSAENFSFFVDMSTTSQVGARLVIYPAGILPGKSVVPRLYFCIDTNGMWQLIGESKEGKALLPLAIRYNTKLRIHLAIEKYDKNQKGNIYIFQHNRNNKNVGKNNILEPIFKNFFLHGRLNASFLLPPGEKNTLKIFELFVAGDDLSIDRRIV